jgi:hypothetical protein
MQGSPLAASNSPLLLLPQRLAGKTVYTTVVTMTHTALEESKKVEAILNLVDGLYDLAFELDAAVTVGLVEDYDFALLQSQLMEFSKDAGGVAHHAHDG